MLQLEPRQGHGIETHHYPILAYMFTSYEWELGGLLFPLLIWDGGQGTGGAGWDKNFDVPVAQGAEHSGGRRDVVWASWEYIRWVNLINLTFTFIARSILVSYSSAIQSHSRSETVTISSRSRRS